MKNLVLVAFVTALSLPGFAHAERFILKNPKAPVVARTIQTMHFGSDTYVVVEAPRFSNLLASFSNSAERVSEDYKIAIPADENPGDEAAAKAWHPDAMKYAELPQLRDGRDVVVAVLDTGVDYNHPALKDHIWTNSKECDATDKTIDNDGNGFIGDCHGFDFDGKDSDPIDGDQHGTHCAGIIGASKDPATNGQGVAPGVKIMAIRIIGDEQTGFLSNAALGIKYAVDNGAKVLSNSWRVYKSWGSFDPSDVNVQLLRDAIKYAGDHGAIFVAAAGNESLDMDKNLGTDPMFPGGFDGLDNMVVVAASDERGNMASFSNYGGSHVTVAAPGNNIISTVPGGRWMSMSGTSMATPLVVGSIARGLSGKMDMNTAVNKLVSTTNVAAPWAGKVKAGGVIDLTKYLAE